MTLWFPFVLFLVKSEAAIFLFYFFYLIKNWLKVDHWGGNLSSQIFDSLLELSSLIYDCKNLLGREWTVWPHHVFHEADGVVDGLAKRAREQTWNISTVPFFFFFFFFCIMQICTWPFCELVLPGSVIWSLLDLSILTEAGLGQNCF